MEEEQEELKCSVCGDKALYDTCFSFVYLCDKDYCILSSAMDNYIEGELE